MHNLGYTRFSSTSLQKKGRSHASSPRRSFFKLPNDDWHDIAWIFLVCDMIFVAPAVPLHEMKCLVDGAHRAASVFERLERS